MHFCQSVASIGFIVEKSRDFREKRAFAFAPFIASVSKSVQLSFDKGSDVEAVPQHSPINALAIVPPFVARLKRRKLPLTTIMSVDVKNS